MREVPTDPGSPAGERLKLQHARCLEVYVSRYCPNCGEARQLRTRLARGSRASWSA